MRAVSRLLVPVFMMGILAVEALALGWPVAATVQAAGGEIQVVAASQQVNYPSGVAVSVTIESEAEIDEVRVYYRPAKSRRWGYAYADFEPGTRVIATQSIPVQEATYIAPGADVEYYFEIRDTEGNVVKTGRFVVEYLDQRFNWQRIDIGPLELVYHDLDDSQVEKEAAIIAEYLRWTQELLGLEESEGFKGVIYKSYADANAAFPVQSQTTTDHGTFAGYAFGEQGVFLGAGLDRRIIVHESAHMLMREALKGKSVEMPAWLNEGFAQYVEPNVRIRSSQDLYDRTPHLQTMRSVSGTPRTIPLFYQKSVSVVAHLIDEYGAEKFRLLIEEIARGRDTDVALVKVYGFDEHGLESSWAGLPISHPVLPQEASADTDESGAESGSSEPGQETVRSQSVEDNEGSVAKTETSPENRDSGNDEASTRPPAQSSTSSRVQVQTQPQRPQEREEPSPFVFLDAWILAGVAILAVVAVAARYVYRWLKPQSDWPEDD